VEERKVVVDGPMGEMEGVADGRSESGFSDSLRVRGLAPPGRLSGFGPCLGLVWIGWGLTGLEWECATCSQKHGLWSFSLQSSPVYRDGTVLEEGRRRAGSGWYDSLLGVWRMRGAKAG
jgi:hypothetical protein